MKLSKRMDLSILICLGIAMIFPNIVFYVIYKQSALWSVLVLQKSNLDQDSFFKDLLGTAYVGAIEFLVICAIISAGLMQIARAYVALGEWLDKQDS